jgi:putative heme-binding domain-containing protein
MGGERGPSIVEARRFRLRSDAELRDLIVKGMPGGGMPGFDLPTVDMDNLVAFLRGLLAPASANPAPGDVQAGEAFFAGSGRCLDCHMVNGKGSALGPDLSDVGSRRKLRQIEEALTDPGRTIASGFAAATVRMRDGRTLRGIIRNQSNFDLQLLGLDGRFHMLRQPQIAEVRQESASLMPPLQADARIRQDLLAFLSRLPQRNALSDVDADFQTSQRGISFPEIAQPAPGEWPTYDGNLTGNRHSPLTQITRENVRHLGVRWMYTIPNTRLQATPIVSKGVMYVTHGNDVHAVDSGAGRLLWRCIA